MLSARIDFFSLFSLLGRFFLTAIDAFRPHLNGETAGGAVPLFQVRLFQITFVSFTLQ